MIWKVTVAFLLMGVATELRAQSLVGSAYAMAEQYRMARLYDYTGLQDPKEVRKFVKLGLLVQVRGNANYSVVGASFPYTRPGTRLFIERLSRQYRSYCGSKLIVTSLTRPVSRQPRNASPRSVHPHGMSVDFRVPSSARCESWLRKSLLELERLRVLQATREKRPPHFHVAVYTEAYQAYVKRKTAPKKSAPKKAVKKPVKKKAPVKKGRV